MYIDDIAEIFFLFPYFFGQSGFTFLNIFFFPPTSLLLQIPHSFIKARPLSFLTIFISYTYVNFSFTFSGCKIKALIARL